MCKGEKGGTRRGFILFCFLPQVERMTGAQLDKIGGTEPELLPFPHPNLQKATPLRLPWRKKALPAKYSAHLGSGCGQATANYWDS